MGGDSCSPLMMLVLCVLWVVACGQHEWRSQANIVGVSAMAKRLSHRARPTIGLPGAPLALGRSRHPHLLHWFTPGVHGSTNVADPSVSSPTASLAPRRV